MAINTNSQDMLIFKEATMAKKENKPQVISGLELMLNSGGKLNKSDPVVFKGTGAHKSVKDYRRSDKHKKNYTNDV